MSSSSHSRPHVKLIAPLLRSRVSGHTDIRRFIGNSPALRDVVRKLPSIVDATGPVLVTGETGTGKDLIARNIHALGPRRKEPFLVQNCAALPADLFESELFGHTAGAFTGATRDRPGLFELAHGGTLFLDEIAELALPLQAKLLRVLEDQRVRRLGDNTERDVDFRLVAATNRDMQSELGAGRFRSDLFYRINVFTVTLPPLRDRREDVPALARHFLEQIARRRGITTPPLARSVLDALGRHDWPGNVRELANVIERAVAYAGAQALAVEHLDLPEQRDQEMRGSLHRRRHALERTLIENAVRRHSGNVSAAARSLDITRQHLSHLLRKHGLDAKQLGATTTRSQ